MFSGAISVTLKKEAAHFSENFEKIIFFYILSIIVVTNLGFFLLGFAGVALLSVALLCVCINLDLTSSHVKRSCWYFLCNERRGQCFN